MNMEEASPYMEILGRHTFDLCRAMGSHTLVAFLTYCWSQKLIGDLDKDAVEAKETKGVFQQSSLLFKHIVQKYKTGPNEKWALEVIIKGLREVGLSNWADILQNEAYKVGSKKLSASPLVASGFSAQAQATSSNLEAKHEVEPVSLNLQNLETMLPILDNRRFSSNTSLGNQSKQEIYIIGGWIEFGLMGLEADIDTYHPEFGCRSTGLKLTQPRFYHQSVFYPPRKELVVLGGAFIPGSNVLLYGVSHLLGANPCLDSTECLYPNLQTGIRTRKMVSMHRARRAFASCLVDDRLYVIGGEQRKDTAMRECEYLDMVKEQWVDIAALPEDLSHMCAVPTKNNRNEDIILIFGGANKKYGKCSNVIYEYSVGTNMWSQRHGVEMPTPLFDYALVKTGSNSITITGGATKIGGDGVKECYEFNFTTGKWQELAPMLEGRSQHASVVYNGNIFVMGGVASADVGARLKSVHMLDGTTWKKKTNLPQVVSHLTAVVVDDDSE